MSYLSEPADIPAMSFKANIWWILSSRSLVKGEEYINRLAVIHFHSANLSIYYELGHVLYAKEMKVKDIALILMVQNNVMGNTKKEKKTKHMVGA